MSKYLALVLVILLSACGGSGDSAAPESTSTTTPASTNDRAVRIESSTITAGTFEEIIELTGSVEATDDAVLSARTSGTITRITDLGKRVGRGYIAAQLDSGLSNAALVQAQAQLESAEASFRLAEDVYNRQEPLFADSIISALEFEQVRTQMNQARAQLNQARGLVAQAEEQVAYTRVTAPFSGTVEEHFAEQGEQVSPGMPILRIVNSNLLKINAGVPERFADDIEVGSPARVSFSAYGIPPMEASVDFVGKAIRSNSRTFPIEISIRNIDGKLKPEMIASVQLERNRLADAIVVPQGAVVRDEEGLSVFVVNRTGDNPVAEKRSVRTGPSFEGKIVITEGVSVGEELITAGMNDVSSGDRVQVVNADGTIAEDAANDAIAS
ncbi:MAG: efflux RND transporter periplasmic adaptor subunit [Rhodothermales bacterium]|nr:efflux RND transporter periplasmic adaptor subunit [Rhodothermales bacterium]